MSDNITGLEELLHHDDFIRWVLKPDEAGNQYWEAWMSQHPERPDLLLKAKEFVQSVYGSEEQDFKALKEKNIAPPLWNRINEQIREETQDFHPKKSFYPYRAAAAVIGLLALGSLWLYQRKTGQGASVSQQPSGMIVGLSGSTTQECINNGSGLKMVYLVDGTKIVLGGKSSLHYENFLQKEKREITLEGEAFFEVAKDAGRPFYVHTHGLLTRVLGTSFRIIARKEEEKITVAVKTGKVAVSPEHPGIMQTKMPEYILQANQQVVFDKHLQTAAKAIVRDSSLLAEPPLPDESFSFSDAQVSTILQKLSTVYSVNIVYDQQQFGKCLITITLDGLTFEEKLDLLCKVLGVKYRIEEATVYMEGKGCL